jgi:hypothetical protein
MIVRKVLISSIKAEAKKLPGERLDMYPLENHNQHSSMMAQDHTKRLLVGSNRSAAEFPLALAITISSQCLEDTTVFQPIRSANLRGRRANNRTRWTRVSLFVDCR